MSYDIPFDIQTEILKKVPHVKSLIRFRSVSKAWMSLIDSSDFIAVYRAQKTQPRTLLLSYKDTSKEVKHLSVNNDTFKVQQELAPIVSPIMKQFNDTHPRCSFCGTLLSEDLLEFEPQRSSIFGFAVCHVTNQPTIVKISYLWKVELFTLSSKKWTQIQCRKSRESIKLHAGGQVVIGSCIYRDAYENFSLRYSYFKNMIVSFDLIDKEFRAIDLPAKITNRFTSPIHLSLPKLNGSLVVIVNYSEVEVWKMEPNCSFTQLFTINRSTTPGSYIIALVGFKKNGELVVETININRSWEDFALKAYNPWSHHINNLGLSGKSGSFFISSYKETLHLLDHRDSCVYPEINRSQR